MEINDSTDFDTKNVDEFPEEVKYNRKTKLSEQILVWCVIAETGYIQKGYLLKLAGITNLHHQYDEIIFWQLLITVEKQCNGWNIPNMTGGSALNLERLTLNLIRDLEAKLRVLDYCVKINKLLYVYSELGVNN